MLGGAGVLLMPLSGFWVIALQAVLILVVARQGRAATAAEAGPVAAAVGNR